MRATLGGDRYAGCSVTVPWMTPFTSAVEVKVTSASPAVARAVPPPAVGPSVHVAVDVPAWSVSDPTIEPPPSTTSHVTASCGIGFDRPSTTSTRSASANASRARPCCASPPTRVSA